MATRKQRMTKTNQKRNQGLDTSKQIHATNPRKSRGVLKDKIPRSVNEGGKLQ